jgi:hypothetical protein
MTPRIGAIRLLERNAHFLGLSLSALPQRDCAHLKRPHSFVGRIEAGERRMDVIEFIEIAHVMGVDPGQLFSKITL